MDLKEKKYIILFDGVCNLCNSSVNLIIDWDTKDKFRFASLQSETGIKLLQKLMINREQIDSIVFVDDNSFNIKSKAILKILSILGFPFSIFTVFAILPHQLLDFGYDFIAKNRYLIFGKKDICRIPTPELKNKFL